MSKNRFIGWLGGDSDEDLSEGLAFYADHDGYVEPDTRRMTAALAWEWCVKLGGCSRRTAKRWRICKRAAEIHNQKIAKEAA